MPTLICWLVSLFLFGIYYHLTRQPIAASGFLAGLDLDCRHDRSDDRSGSGALGTPNRRSDSRGNLVNYSRRYAALWLVIFRREPAELTGQRLSVPAE